MHLTKVRFECLEHPKVPGRLINGIRKGVVSPIRPAKTGLDVNCKTKIMRTV